MSYAATALLEIETPATQVEQQEPKFEKDSTETLAFTPDSPTQEEGEANQQDDLQLRFAFNVAYDALNANISGGIGSALTEGSNYANLVNGGNMGGSTGIGAGLRLAMGLQKNIIATAVNLVERNAITRLRHFRYAFLTSRSRSNNNNNLMQDKQQEYEQHVFSKPLALTKLAHYLMDMHRENGKWTGGKARPLILAAEKPVNGTFMVVGYEYPELAGSTVRNRFGEAFSLAAKTMKGTFRFDSFDSNVMEVAAEDGQRFIEQLHYMMDSST
mmetsp:Transcript_24889/g.38326  ORF Transcript_24889/g.38326 Transcript_24889/m.38326 type:complete len:272 (+) Transcript_24889:420-1235(+)